MHKKFLVIGALLCAASVAFGAFGAHGLKGKLDPSLIASFETGVRYQFYHSFAILIAGILYGSFPNRWMRYSGNLFVAGILMFSGSLYLLTLFQLSGTVGLRGIGIITPVGGIILILGWLAMVYGMIEKFNTKGTN